jgi:muramoyltetrapeptide carboxypeptidase
MKAAAATSVIRPPRLRQGDTIAVVAPASPFDADQFTQGVAAIDAMGFHVTVSGGVFERCGYLAGSDRHRVRQIHRCFADPHIRAIFCARGGYGSLRLLSLLDIDLIRRHPKIFVGFSDVSVLLHALVHAAGLVAFHGPTVNTLSGLDRASVDSLFAALSLAQPPAAGFADGVTLAPGTVTAPVAGGNLTSLCHLVGTPFSPVFRQCILFIEDVNEAPYRIDRMLNQMQLAGCFRGVAGVILGTFKDCGDVTEIYDLARDIFGTQGVPIAAGLPVGHAGTNLTLPLGCVATFDADQRRLRYHQPATSDAASGAGETGVRI